VGSPVLTRMMAMVGRMVDAKTTFDERHTYRVANLSREIAILMRCDEDQVEAVGLTAHVSGAGKLALPSSLLLSPGPLSADQRATLVEVPHITAGILAPIIDAGGDWLKAAASVSERLDGSGYPLGARGSEVSQAARILAAVDTYEALIADRPYRQAHARARALHILQAQSGLLFDGVVTDTLEGLTRGEL
jgi:putative two-component system response regulator